ncbi:MAG: hypothetical protein C4523_14290 [Myxococcales bacterium]|nr:MAG: hypothetical protein C4523_14290 [Myxococcales bacterium]
MTPAKPMPYENDAQYLDHEFSWVKAHAAALDCEKKLADADRDEGDSAGRMVGKTTKVAAKDLTRRLAELKAEATAIRSEIDARLAVHRQSKTFTLGFDLLCESTGLSDEERKIVLFLTLPAVALQVASDIYAGLGYFGSSFQIGEVVQLLRPQGVGDWLRCRRMFHVTSPLVRNNVVTQDWPTKNAHPADLLNATVSLTVYAFAVVVGEPDLIAEGLPSGGDDSMSN